MKTQKLTIKYVLALHAGMTVISKENATISYGNILFNVGVITTAAQKDQKYAINAIFGEDGGNGWAQKTRITNEKDDFKRTIDCETILYIPESFVKSEKVGYRPALFFTERVVYFYIPESKGVRIDRPTKFSGDPILIEGKTLEPHACLFIDNLKTCLEISAEKPEEESKETEEQTEATDLNETFSENPEIIHPAENDGDEGTEDDEDEDEDEDEESEAEPKEESSNFDPDTYGPQQKNETEINEESDG